jgi:hypothetical protein
MSTDHTIIGGWRYDQLRLVYMGVQPIEQTLHVVGVRARGSLLDRARQDLTDATEAHKAGDEYTAEALTAALAVEITKQRQMKGRAAA